jgi:uncharacterized protein YdaU (DUF1376 family)
MEAAINFYKRHIGDYIKDAGHLKLLEHGVYARLMDVYYTRESGIPEDKAARLIGASTRPEMEALKNVLDEFFDLVDGIWIQKRCEEEITVANSKAEKNRENGSKGGRPKRNQTENKPAENPVGSDSVSEKNLSQTPDSRLQTPDINPDTSSQASTEVRDDDPPPIVPPSARAESVAAQPLPRNGAIAVLLRGYQIDATSQNPVICCEWAENPLVTDEVLTLAAVKARKAKPNERIHFNYVKPIVEELLTARQAKPSAANQVNEKFNFSHLDRSGDRAAMEASMKRHGITQPSPDEEIEI